MTSFLAITEPSGAPAERTAKVGEVDDVRVQRVECFLSPWTIYALIAEGFVMS